MTANDNSVDFAIGRDVASAEAIEQARKLAAFMLPGLVNGAPDEARLCAAVTDVLIELVDLTARYPASGGLVGQLSYDESHVMVSVGDMGRALPSVEEEPGLHLVYRLVEDAGADIGQHVGDRGGWVTWVAVAV
ncbi:hypothetical protein ACFCWY_08515 [Streptomyces sp. NPDC056362]|uniref:hypothetical protein n=1 Tax=unclassified Streptomyces TaxID=2593676 RepID=UPI0035DB0ED7